MNWNKNLFALFALMVLASVSFAVSYPDLDTIYFTYDSDSTGDGVCDSFNIHFKNIGDASLNSAVTAIVKVNGVEKYSATYGPSNANFFPVDPGETWFDRIFYNQLGAYSGDLIEVYLDPSNTIRESNENNNDMTGGHLPVSAAGCRVPTAPAAAPTYPATTNSLFSIFVYGSDNARINNAYVTMYKASDNSRVRGFYTDSNGEAKFYGYHFEDNINVYFKAEKDGYTYDSIDGRNLAFVDTGTTEKGFCNVVNGAQSSCSRTGYALTKVTAPATPQQPTCSDSDGGNDIYTKGTLRVYTPSYGSQTVLEYCVDSNGARQDSSNYVEELVCLSGDPTYAYRHATTQCPSGYSCSDGACARSTTTPTSEPNTANFYVYVYDASNNRVEDATVGAYKLSDGSLIRSFSTDSNGATYFMASELPDNENVYFVAKKGDKSFYSIDGKTSMTFVDTGTAADGYCQYKDGLKQRCNIGSYALAKEESTATTTPAESTTQRITVLVVDGSGNPIPNYVNVYLYYKDEGNNNADVSRSLNADGTTTMAVDVGRPFNLDGYHIDTYQKYGASGAASGTPTKTLIVKKVGTNYQLCGYSDGECTSVMKVILYPNAVATTPTPESTTGYTVKIGVGVNDYPDHRDGSRIQNIDGYVNIYKVVPVSSGVYKGYLIETKKSPKDEGALFTITPGQIVDFVAFKSLAKAQAATEWKFSSPPYKNFGDYTDRICQINFLDSNSKMVLSDGSYSCGTSLGYPYSDGEVSTPVTPTPVSPEYKIWVRTYSTGHQDAIPGATVYMYKLADGSLLDKQESDANGEVWFSVPANTKVYFVASKDGTTYTMYGESQKDYYKVYYFSDRNQACLLKSSASDESCPLFGVVLYPSHASVTPMPVSTTYTLVLQKGWNQLSVPFISGTMTGNSCGSDTIFLYDATNKEYKKTALSGSVQGFNYFGFWMKATEPCKLQFETNGFYYANQIESLINSGGPGGYKLYAGWNMVGAPYDGVSFESIKGSCEVKSGPWNYNPSANRWQKAENLKPGEGYFIKVSSDCVLGSGDNPPAPPN